jgi:hypothetical protein
VSFPGCAVSRSVFATRSEGLIFAVAVVRAKVIDDTIGAAPPDLAHCVLLAAGSDTAAGAG